MNARFFDFASKIKKTGIHSLFSFAAAGGESLLRQPPKIPFPAAVWLRQIAAGKGILRSFGGHAAR
jgi:hypothetical protein